MIAAFILPTLVPHFLGLPRLCDVTCMWLMMPMCMLVEERLTIHDKLMLNILASWYRKLLAN